MNSHQLFASISPGLASEILEYTFTEDKPIYRATMDAVAQFRKVRPIFLERQPRTARHQNMIASLGRPAMETAAETLVHNWLLKAQASLLTDFLDALKISHEKGLVQDLPATMDDETLRAAVDALLAKYPGEKVGMYLHAFHKMNNSRWANLAALLDSDERLWLNMG